MKKTSIIRCFILAFVLLISLGSSAVPTHRDEVIIVDCCKPVLPCKKDSITLDSTMILKAMVPIKDPFVITRPNLPESEQTQRQMLKAADTSLIQSTQDLPDFKHHIKAKKLQVRKDETYLPFPVIM